MVPVFISSTKDGQIGLDRIGGISSSYFISLPISIALCLLMILLNIKFILTKKYILHFFAYLVFCILLNTLFNNTLSFSILKITTWMFTFIVLNYVFRNFFSSKIDSISDISLVEKKYIIYPMVLILIVTLISHYTYGKGVFLFEGINIYNFWQYYSLLFVLMLGSAARYNLIIFSVLFAASLLLSEITDNHTAKIITILTAINYLLYYTITNSVKKALYKFTIYSVFIFFLFFPLSLFLFTNEVNYVGEVFGAKGYGIENRYGRINYYFTGIEWFQIFLPFLTKAKSVGSSFHNELLEVFNATGIIGVVLYYSYIISTLLNYNKHYIHAGLSVLFVVFIAGTMIESTLHSYTLVILSYFMSFYFVASKKISSSS